MSAKVRIALLAFIGAAALSIAAVFSIAGLRSPGEEYKTAYRWSANLTIALPEAGKQRVETTLATDKNGRVLLSYLDADYSRGSPSQGGWATLWMAWPRRLIVVTSGDQGKTFGNPYLLSPMGGNASFATDADGNVYASWVQYSYDDHKHLEARIAAAQLDADAPSHASVELQCPIWSSTVKHDQSNLTVSDDGTIHIIGLNVELTMQPSDRDVPRLLYARSRDGLKSCVDQVQLRAVGVLPELVSTRDALLIVGSVGFYSSADNGETFGPEQPYRFGDRLVRVAADHSRGVAYIVGDAVTGGLWLNRTTDGGKSWHKARVDDARQASAWRFPAIAVSKSGRVHVVWMDDREGYGAVYHAYSDDGGQSFSRNERVSDKAFPFPSDAPPPPPANQRGTWVGDYLSVTTVAEKVVVAWSDQRAGTPLSGVYAAVGSPGTFP